MRTPALLLSVILAACGGGQPSAADTSAASAVGISDIQGPGPSSPLAGQTVIVEGVVTGDFQDGDSDPTRDLGGFYIQDEPDGDPATSDGVFIFDGRDPDVDIDVGDRVRVTGEVVEHFGETQVIASDVTVTGAGVVAATALVLPVATRPNSDGELVVDLEALEGMLVRFPQTLTVSQLRNQERFGEILLSEGGRQSAYTNSNSPSVAGYRKHTETIASQRIHLDDGLRTAGVILPVRNGDEINDLTGVVRFSRGSGPAGTAAYRLMPTVEPRFVAANPRPGPPTVTGDLRIATFNANNFFSTVDDGRSICSPAGNAACRGADSALELSRQLEKIVTALTMIDAGIVALVELENNERASLQVIVDALNVAAREERYAFINSGSIGDDGIKVGLIYQPSLVRPAGDFAILDSSTDPRFNDNLNRPVLAQSFDTVIGNERLTVLALHLKSKGSSCDSVDDPDIGDGQGNCSATRTLAAAAIVDWVASDPTDSGTDRTLIIGDINTHTLGDAVTRFETAGYVNLAPALNDIEPYSFEFDGQFGALDHALASPTLAEIVVDAVEWRINADESRVHDYNLDFDRDPAIFNGSEPYRSSDHDPLIIGIDLDY